jgi:hypothetical protein
MQVHGSGEFTIVDEPDDSFAALFHTKRGTWGDTIVTIESSGLETFVDLLLECLDLNLVVVDNGTCRLVLVLVLPCLRRRLWQWVLKDLFVHGAEPSIVTGESLGHKCCQSEREALHDEEWTSRIQ